MATPFQRSFAGGEVTPALGARADTVKYQSGLQTCRNFIVERTGAVSNRPGTQYLATAKGATGDERLVKWTFNDEQSYVLEFGVGYIRVFEDGAAVLDAAYLTWTNGQNYIPGQIVNDGVGDYFYCVATHKAATADNKPTLAASLNDFWYELSVDTASSTPIVEIPTPYSQTDLADLDFAQSSDVMTVTHRSHPPHEIVRTAATRWTCLPSQFKPDSTAPTGLQGGTYDGVDALGGTVYPVHDYYYKVTAVLKDSGVESSPAVSNTTTADCAVTNADGTTDDLTVDNGTATHGLADGDEVMVFNVECQSAARANENAVRMLEGRVFSVTLGDELGANTTTMFSLNDTAGLLTDPAISDISGDGYPDIQVDWGLVYVKYEDRYDVQEINTDYWMSVTWTAVDDAEEYLCYRRTDNGPYGLMGATKELEYIDDGTLDPDTSLAPPTYRTPFRSGKFPRATAYYQQRQAFAGTTDEPQVVQMSVTGDFYNFSTRSPLQADDAVRFEAVTTDAGEIERISTLGQMLIFGNSTIWTSRGDADGLVTPTNINLEVLSYEGASRLRPLVVGDSLLFNQARGSKVRELRFDLGTGGFTGYAGRDLSVFAQHLFDGYTVDDWDYAPVPFSVVWAVRSDGTLLSLTYLQEHDLFAWARHDTAASGKFLSTCVVIEDNRDVPYVLVQRTINSSTVYYIERMAKRIVGHGDYDARDDTIFMDSSLTYDGSNLLYTNVTAPTTSLTIEAGADWTAGSTHNLLASASAFDGSEDGFRLAVGTTEVSVTVVGASSDDATNLTVTVDAAVPAALQAVATTDWVRLVDSVSGLDHLEGETVVVYADNNVLVHDTDGADLVVTSGAITLSDTTQYGIVHAGLQITADIELLDGDIVSARSSSGSLTDAVADRLKLVTSASLVLSNTRGLKVGQDADNLFDLGTDPEDTANALITGKRRVRMDSTWTKAGTFLIRQTDPLPATILGVIPHVDIGGR